MLLTSRNSDAIIKFHREKLRWKNFKNICKKVLTDLNVFVRITLAAEQAANSERYRSGHNEAVLKTVCPKGRVGSNPTLSAGDTFSPEFFLQLNIEKDSTIVEKYPRGWRDTPGKGAGR